MRVFSLAVVLLSCGGPVFGQTTLPNPASLPAQALTPSRAPIDAQATELLKAAEHLEAAGLKRDADKLRSKANVARQFVEDSEQLARKLDELKILQAEIGRLRLATNTPATELVMLQVHVVELNRARMREAGFDVESLRKDQIVHVKDGQTLLATLRKLQQHKVAKILAEPTIVTTSGRAAYFNAGGEFPVPGAGDAPLRYVPYGTQVECTALILDEGTIRVKIKPRVSELDRSREIEVQGIKLPSVIVREINTEVEVVSGQTAVLGGLVRKAVETLADGSEKTEEIELLVLVNAELVAAETVARRTMAPHLDR